MRFGLGEEYYEKMYYMFVKIQFADKISCSDRIRILLYIAGSHYHYAHQHKELIEMVTYHNTVSEDKVDLSDLDKWISNCIELEKERSENTGRSCSLTGNNEYDVKIHNWKWDYFNKRNVVETSNSFICPSCGGNAVMEETIDLENDKKQYECYECGYKIADVDNLADLEKYLSGITEEKVDIRLASDGNSSEKESL
jgi:predicted RNA-binding Zn-ribbon protein involved in translation (DUF1610 family)